jgi:dolichol-phosphate mannosyltransferase
MTSLNSSSLKKGLNALAGLMKVSVLMPCYNEASHIRSSLMKVGSMLEGTNFDYEIVVVDDGSTDGTAEEASKIPDGHVKIVGYQPNRGKGHALRYGFQKVAGDVVVFMDSDSEIATPDINSYIHALASADIAIGSKRNPRSVVEAPIARRFLSYWFNTLARLMTGIRIPDTQSGLKAARREALERIFPLLSVRRYAFDLEMLTVATVFRMRIVDLPIKVHQSVLFSVRHIIRMFVDMAGIAYRSRVLRWYQKNAENQRANYKPIIRW